MSSSPVWLMRTRFEIYCDILYRGLLAIRCQTQDPELCFAHADHLHNLPELFRNFENESLHNYYWNCMRDGLVHFSRQRNQPEIIQEFQPLWDELEEASR
jgi:hypothetical protein